MRAMGSQAGEERRGLALASPIPRGLALVLAIAFVLQLLTWARIEGYQLADSVEYLERAHDLAFGIEHRAEGAVRSVGFASLFVPLFAAQRALGIEDGRWVVPLARLVQMAIGLGLLVAVARVGNRLGGERVGTAAALLAAATPIFLTWTVSPVSGACAALCVALALDPLLAAPPRPRNALAAGLWLGAALLFHYQTLLLSALATLALLAVARGRRLATAGALLVGVAAGAAVQILLDRVAYGEWGVSLLNYALENGGAVLVRIAHELGFNRFAGWLYLRVAERAHGLETALGSSAGAADLSGPMWYLTELPQAVPWPTLALGVLGTATLLARRSPRGLGLVWLLAGSVAVMSLKGSKSFRLWLPLLPLVAPIAACGLVPLGAALARARPGARALATAWLVAALLAGADLQRERPTRRFGAYWRAIDFLNERAPAAQGRPRVAAAYHWAIFLRERPELEVIKLPYPLFAFDRLEPDEQQELLAALDGLDALLIHLPVLREHPAVAARVAARFCVRSAFWDEETDPLMGCVLVLTRASGERGEARLGVVHEGVEPERFRWQRDLDRELTRPLDLVRHNREGGLERLRLLGFRWQPLEGEDRVSWITYYWTSDTGLGEDFVLVDRITDPSGAHAWQNDHEPLWGTRPTSGWHPGEILSEGYPLLPGEEAFTARFAPLGGPWRRGDLVPASLWIRAVKRNERGEVLSELFPARPGEPEPIDFAAAREVEGGHRETEDGWRLSADGLVRAGRFFLPVPEAHRWPDDGRPDPP